MYRLSSFRNEHKRQERWTVENIHGVFIRDKIKNALTKTKNPLKKYKNSPTFFALNKYKKGLKHYKMDPKNDKKAFIVIFGVLSKFWGLFCNVWGLFCIF